MMVELRCRNQDCGRKFTAVVNGEIPRHCPLCATKLAILRSRFLLSDLKYEARQQRDARQGITAGTFDTSQRLRALLSEVRREPLDLTELVRTVPVDITGWLAPRPWPLCATCATSRQREESHG
jgi:hypothetical protein